MAPWASILAVFMALTPGVTLELPPALLALLPDADRQGLADVVSAAVPLLWPHLKAGSASGLVAELFVVGEARWLDAFLKHLPPVALVHSLGNDDVKWSDDKYLHVVPLATSVTLVAEDSAEALSRSMHRLSYAEPVRKLFWASSTPVGLEDDLDVLMKEASKSFLQTRLAVSVSNGTTVLHDVPFERACTGDQRPTLLDLWSADRGWQGGGDSLFDPPCLAWRPPLTPGPLQIDFMPSLTLHYVSNKILTSIPRSELPPHQQRRLSLACEDLWVLRARSCRLDALVSPLPVRNSLHQGLTVFPWGMSRPSVVVPASLGRSPHGVLYALTHEFSYGVWNLLLLALMAVAAGLHLIRGAPVEVVLLQALAPTLRQYTRVREQGYSLRLLLGCWMLVSVVLIAAYEAKLLSELTVVHPPDEMDLDQLAESDLEILMMDRFYLQFYGGVPPLQARQGRGITYRPHYNYTINLESFAAARNSAILMNNEWRRLVDPLADGSGKRLHAFKLPVAYQYSLFITSKGSPLERPLRKYKGRLEAAGLILFWFQQAHDIEGRRHKLIPQRPNHAQHHHATKRPPTALVLNNLLPAFAVLTAGLAGALVAFCAENVRAENETTNDV